MLGLTTSDQNWRWVVCGKHPSAKDYFNIGRKFPLADNFSGWIENGYPAFAERNKSVQGLYSWRFWSRGSVKNELACGLLRDSSDGFGRPYPLLVIGVGSVPSWEEHWESLPFACEKTWNQIEYLTTQKYRDLKVMEFEIQKTRPPGPDWPDCNDTNGVLTETSATSQTSATENGQLESNLSIIDEWTVFLVIEDRYDSFDSICDIHRELKRQLESAPNAVFIGGTSERTCLVVFTRPLKQADFVTLWSAAANIN